MFPLYLFEENMGKKEWHYNLNPDCIKKFEQSIEKNLSFDNSESTFTGFELICYIYAILYSLKYRHEYNEYLKYDFPVIQLPKNSAYFSSLVEKGKQLIALHNPDNFYNNNEGQELLPKLQSYIFNSKEKAIILNDSLSINVSWDGCYEFEIGGYKPLQKWLKDRKGTSITAYDIEMIKKIVKTIENTYQIMTEIDEIIEI